MTTTRREFMQTSAGATAAIAAGALSPLGMAMRSFGAEKAAKPLNLLILGGTGFLGPAIVETATARGHTMTLFNRGRTNTHLFPDLEKLQGDRDGDLEALKGRDWDAVIDTSGYVPRLVRDSAELLADHCKHYTFISTISVYASALEPGLDESDPVGTLEDPTVEEVTGQTYGPLKALCEQAAEDALPGRVAIIRPGLIVGPRDNTDRFTYWPVRIHRGGEVLAPQSPDNYAQFIDVRDLAEWNIRVIEDNVTGVFNATGPAKPLPFDDMLKQCRKGVGGDATFTWVPAEFLMEHNVRPWADMPVWIPAEGDYTGFAQRSVAKAVAAGLTFRSTADTARATLEWFETLPEERQANLRAGLSPEREAEVLAAWHESQES